MGNPKLSFEFFPPRNDLQASRFWRTFGCIETLAPEWVSVTYGALGSASQASVDTVGALQKDNTLAVAAHLTCGGLTKTEMNAKIDEFIELGVRRFVALRGDNPNTEPNASEPVFQYASDLVALLAERNEALDISVAAYPEVHPDADSAEQDMQALKTKLDAGASRALTQFFFEPEVFLRWRDSAQKAGITKPLIPGILPIHNIERVIDFSARCGATVPNALIELFRNATTEEECHQRAIEHSLDLCRTLHNEGVEDFHIYTLNQSTLAYSISCELLGVRQLMMSA